MNFYCMKNSIANKGLNIFGLKRVMITQKKKNSRFCICEKQGDASKVFRNRGGASC